VGEKKLERSRRGLLGGDLTGGGKPEKRRLEQGGNLSMKATKGRNEGKKAKKGGKEKETRSEDRIRAGAEPKA